MLIKHKDRGADRLVRESYENNETVSNRYFNYLTSN